MIIRLISQQHLPALGFQLYRFQILKNSLQQLNGDATDVKDPLLLNMDNRDLYLALVVQPEWIVR